ncbi:AAA family ATPase [Pseudomonas sp. SG20052]|jgi:AAA15 family ATPase/GTPase|uniref:AAA family ATPase n=1 Tax=Pseudomonas sp. SG20052 TaxID=3074147 RepID=UPI00287F9ED7|nr:AAA family ATPase [Pseudomonas sp. SG20052]WNF56065.1 AAA family ATPase [Pseudomonas sp. SG20052]
MSIINKLVIKGFKSIWQDTLDLGQMNVFIGTNGAGKSNLLEAIAMLSSSLEGGIDYEKLQKRGARLSSSAIFRSAFRNKNRTSALQLMADFGDISYSMDVNAADGFRYLAESVKLNGKAIAGRSNKGARIYNSPLQSKLDNTKSIFPYLDAFKTINSNLDEEDILAPLTSLMDYAIFAPTTPILRGVETDSSAKDPLGLYGGRLAEALTEMLRAKDRDPELLSFFRLLNWVQSFTTTDETDPELISGQINISGRKIRYQDKFMKTNFNKLYAYDVSEGALYVIFMLVLLTHKKSPNIFSLDNIDTALNPGLVRDLMAQVVRILKKNPNKQVFLTTHNPSTLDALDLFDPSHRLFVVERDKDGHTKSRRIMPPSDMTKEQWESQFFGMKLSEIWLSGAIGGLPTGF